MLSPSPSTTAASARENVVVVLAILTAIGVVLWALVATFGSPPGPVASTPSVPPPPSRNGTVVPTPVATVIPNGTPITVEAQQTTVYRYTNLSSTNYMIGAFTARYASCPGCPGPLGVVLVLNATGYATFNAGVFNFSIVVGPSGSAVYAQNGTVFSKLSPGAYYVVFWNNGAPASNPPENYTTIFTVTSAFEVYSANATPPVPPESPRPVMEVGPFGAQLGGTAYGGQGVVHVDVDLPVSYWSWNVNGSCQCSGGASVDIDASFFGFSPTIYASNLSPTSSFNTTLPAGTYVLAIVDTGWNVGCYESLNGCPVFFVSISGLFAEPL